MYKIIGAVFTFFAVLAFGCGKSRMLYKRYDTLEKFHKSVSQLRSEISLRQTHLQSAFKLIGEKYKNPCFIRSAELIEELGAEAAFNKAVSETCRDFGLLCEDYNAILEISPGLGRCDTENQLRQLDYALGLLRQASDNALGIIREKSGVFIRSAILAASAIVIIFI